MGNRKIMRAVAFAALLCLAASTVSFPTDSQNVVTSLDVGEADGVVACTSANCNGDGGSGGADSGGRSYSSSSGGNSYSSSRGNSSVAELGANLELSQTASKRKPAAEGPPQEAAPKRARREKKKGRRRKGRRGNSPVPLPKTNSRMVRDNGSMAIPRTPKRIHITRMRRPRGLPATSLVLIPMTNSAPREGLLGGRSMQRRRRQQKRRSRNK